MPITNDIINLILDITNTRSSVKIHRIVLEFLVSHKDYLSRKQEITLLAVLQERISKQSNEGKAAIKKRSYGSPKKEKFRTYKKPIFVANYTACLECASCKQLIDSKNAFRWMIDGQYIDYHATTECFPLDSIDLFRSNIAYNTWKAGII